MSKQIAAFVLVCAVAFPATGQDVDREKILEQLLSQVSLKCSFTHGASGSWKSGRLSIEPTDWEPSDASYYDGIDVKAGTARIVGDADSGNVRVVATPAGLHFIEFTDDGSLSTTTVFPSLDANGHFLAVISTHVEGSDPRPSQYYGACQRWQYLPADASRPRAR